MLKGVYAPTVLKDGDTYRLWYTDVSKSPWLIRYAESRDGRAWSVDPEAVLKVDQDWELSRLFYPTVRKVDGVLLMWYGSYWKGQGSQKTALGFAVSRDGRQLDQVAAQSSRCGPIPSGRGNRITSRAKA